MEHVFLLTMGFSEDFQRIIFSITNFDFNPLTPDIGSPIEDDQMTCRMIYTNGLTSHLKFFFMFYFKS